MSLGGLSGYAINPARDIGPRLAHAVLPIKGKGDSDWKYAIVTAVGPVIGALAAVGLYAILPWYEPSLGDLLSSIACIA